MIGTLLLSLPLIYLIVEIIYFSYHLYKLNQVQIPAVTSEALTYEFPDFDEDDGYLYIRKVVGVVTKEEYETALAGEENGQSKA